MQFLETGAYAKVGVTSEEYSMPLIELKSGDGTISYQRAGAAQACFHTIIKPQRQTQKCQLQFEPAATQRREALRLTTSYVLDISKQNPSGLYEQLLFIGCTQIK